MGNQLMGIKIHSNIARRLIGGAIILIWALFLLSACEESRHFLFDDPAENLYQVPGQSRHVVFFESSPTQLAMYELASNSFIGMYTDAVPGPDGRVIAPIEATLGVQHAAFMEVMYLGGEFPFMWMLECIAGQKMPIVMIIPPETDLSGAPADPFNLEWESLLTQAAMNFAAFPVPTFVIFYPVPADSLWDADTYIAFFRYARALFARHAPHVAFVWSVDSELENFMDFYPGELAADWVGMSLFSHSTDSFQIPLQFYHTFQQAKPIMLNIGISHFSTADHRYYIAETAFALEKVLQTILPDFPRVRMVNYMDISRVDYNGRDYRISRDATLRTAYRESLRGFATEAPGAFDDSLVVLPIRSAYNAVVEDGQIYLDFRILEELGKHYTGQLRWIDGNRRVDAALAGVNAEVYNGHVWIR